MMQNDIQKEPLLAVRGTNGLELMHPQQGELRRYQPFGCDDNPRQQTFTWSNDGSLLAYCNGVELFVVKLPDCDTVWSFPRPNVTAIRFSPLNKFLLTFEPVSNANHHRDNVVIYNLERGDAVGIFTCKNSSNWEFSFTEDESVCAKSHPNTVNFYENGNFSEPAHQLHIKGISSFALSTNSPPHLAVFLPGDKKGSPSIVKLFQYPNLDPFSAVSSKSFMKGDHVSLMWNSKGTGCLIKAMTDVDKTGKSYYGESNIFFISTDGSGSTVPLSKEGPIHSLEWSPKGNEFLVVYGYQPSKATLYNCKCDSVYDFGTGNRTSAYFNPQATVIALAGFGNIRGNVELWDRAKLQLINKVEIDDITYIEWSPLGDRFFTATLAPRLKVNNGFSLWDYKGVLLHRWDIPTRKDWENNEVYQVQWQSKSITACPPLVLDYTPMTMQQVKAAEAGAKKYVPPALRGKTTSTGPTRLKEGEELPENEKLLGSQGATKKGMAPQVAAASDAKKRLNRMKGLDKKLKEIDQLKTRVASGEQISTEQTAKINRETEMREELEKLRLS